jgi:hypothetical protein
VLRHEFGYALAKAGHDTRAIRIAGPLALSYRPIQLAKDELHGEKDELHGDLDAQDVFFCNRR